MVKFLFRLLLVYVLAVFPTSAQVYHEGDKEDLRSFLRQGTNYEKLGFSASDTLSWYDSEDWIEQLSDNVYWKYSEEYEVRLCIVGFVSKGLEGNLKLNSSFLITLNCRGNNLSELDVSANTSLEYLDCSNNNLTLLDVSDNSELIDLNCHHNNLSVLELSQNIKLRELDCSSNNLTLLDVSTTDIRTIGCSNNHLSSLEFSNNIELVSLECTDNDLTSLDISNNDKLDNLQCGNNHLTLLDVSNNIKLQVLGCSNNHLTLIDVSNNLGLEKFNCGGNHLTLLDVSNNIKLTALGCSNNDLTVLDISNNSALEYLECFDNELKFSLLPMFVPLSSDYYQYSPQKTIFGGIKTYTDLVDLSSEYNINGNITIYEWYDISSGEEEEIVQPLSTNGIFTFTTAHEAKKLRCKLTNGQFPALTLLYETDLSSGILDSVLTSFTINPNPNSTSGDVIIKFVLLNSEVITLEISDITGNLLNRISGFYTSGEHSIILDTTNIPSGTCTCRMLVNGRQVGILTFVIAK